MKEQEHDAAYKVAELIRKHLEESITPEEKSLLEQWLQEKETNRELFLRLTKEENIKRAMAIFRQIAEEKASIFQNITEQIHHLPAKVITSSRTRKWKYVVAASVVLFVSVTAYFYINRNATSNKNVSNTIVERYKNDVPPGGNKAMLTLADGSTIVLDSAGNGTLAQQGNVKVVKLDSGQLSYQISPGSYRGDKGQPAMMAYNVLTTPKGGQYQVLLPDGSKVWLNAATSLRFPTAFADRERKVELTGEAYFEIARNPARPFRVTIVPPSAEASALQKREDWGEVEVLGTHFNVMAYDDESDIKTTLLEGVVKVTKGTAHTLLQPGQQAQLSKHNEIRVIHDTDVEEAVAWKNGLFHFRSADLKTIMRQVARWYNVEVNYEGNIPERIFTGKISRKANASEVLKVLELSGIYFRIEGKKIVVMSLT